MAEDITIQLYLRLSIINCCLFLWRHWNGGKKVVRFKNNKITIKKLVPNLEETSRNLSREEWKKSENTQITFDKENLIDEIKNLI